jgi:hypothetical protein
MFTVRLLWAVRKIFKWFYNFFYFDENCFDCYIEPVRKDNPAFSMINDSDEDVVYDSGDDSKRPLNAKLGNKTAEYDSD